MKKTALVLIGAMAGFFAVSQNLQLDWAYSIGSINGGMFQENGNDITSDKSGNIYTTGNFSGIADFDPGPGTFELQPSGLAANFITKTDSTGNFIWAKTFDTASGISIAIDSACNVYTTGSFNGTVDFDPGAGVFELTSTGMGNCYLTKLDSAGNFIWAVNFESDFYWSNGTTLGLDKTGNIFLGGSFKGNCDFDPGPGVYSLNSGGAETMYILKLDSSGNFLWARNAPASELNICYELAIDDSSNIYATGYFKDTVDFDSGVDSYVLTADDMDVFVWKLDSSGNFVWAKSFGGSYSDHAEAIAIDKDGFVYLTGNYYGTVDFDPGPAVFEMTIPDGYSTIFLSKLDASGNFVWARHVIGSHAYSICTDAAGSIYVAGFSNSGTYDFDPGPAVFNLTSNGAQDIFISKISTLGDFLTAVNMGGNDEEQCYAIRLDKDGNILCTGFFWYTSDLDPGAGVSELVSNGARDIYIQKLSPCMLQSGTDVVTTCGSYTWIDGVTYTTGNTTASYMLVDSSGCDSTVVLNLLINPNPDFTASASGMTMTANEAGAVYEWLNCDSGLILSGETSQSYTASSEGNYAVIITLGSCSDTSDCMNLNSIGINEGEEILAWTVFPNPASDSFTISLKNGTNARAELYDAVGNLIQVYEMDDSSMIFSVDKLLAGVYFLQVIIDDQKTQQRLVLNK